MNHSPVDVKLELLALSTLGDTGAISNGNTRQIHTVDVVGLGRESKGNVVNGRNK